MTSTPYPNGTTYLHACERLNKFVADYLDDPREHRVLSTASPGDLIDALPDAAPEDPEGFDEVMDDVERLIMPGITHWNHPRFMAYFAITGSAPGVLGETLSAALNVNGMLWKTSPAVTELETVTMGWLRAMLQLPQEWFGLIMDTASVATLVALAGARERLGLEIRERGMAGRTDLPTLRVYTSNQSHSSIEKAAIVLGIGRSNVVAIDVDEDFRMRPDVLEAAIEADLNAGYRPMAVVATVGTTSTTSVDPVPEIADISQAHDLWLHVDAAYGGSAAICPEHRHFLNGCDRADSFVFNPHKWLFVPIDCTAFYTAHPETIRNALTLVPEYLTTETDALTPNLMDYGVQLGRRFRALKLWFVLRMFGARQLRAAVAHHIEMAQQLSAWIDAGDLFERMAPTPMSTVCFRAAPAGMSEEARDTYNAALLARVNEDGAFYLSHTVLRGRYTIRVAIGNLGTEVGDVEALQGVLARCASKLDAAGLR